MLITPMVFKMTGLGWHISAGQAVFIDGFIKSTLIMQPWRGRNAVFQGQFAGTRLAFGRGISCNATKLARLSEADTSTLHQHSSKLLNALYDGTSPIPPIISQNQSLMRNSRERFTAARTPTREWNRPICWFRSGRSSINWLKYWSAPDLPVPLRRMQRVPLMIS